MSSSPRPTLIRSHPAGRPPNLVAMMQHELRTPLTVVHGHAQLLQHQLHRLAGVTDADLMKLQHSAVAIERACHHLAAIIDRLDPLDPDDAPGRDSPR